jgi:hypothetical protein
MEKKIREMECKSNTRSRNIKRQECVSMLMRKYVMYGGFIYRERKERLQRRVIVN